MGGSGVGACAIVGDISKSLLAISASSVRKASNFAVLRLHRVEIINPSLVVLLGNLDGHIMAFTRMSDLMIIYTKYSLMSNLCENN